MRNFINKYKWTILWTGTIIILSFIKLPETSGPILFPYADKIVHLFLYLILGWLMTKEIQNKYFAAFYIILLGILIELGQSLLTTYRTGDYIDFLADLIGGYIGLYHKNIIQLIK